MKNFNRKGKRVSEEFSGTFWEYEHVLTGAKVAWLENEEENKVFSISFRTIPKDDTGVFHILEHSVLNGSKHYPVKEPFVELLKSSMNTFLNAMTYGDKTVFPVASRNEKDFMNLMRVYLDAVFFPKIYENKNIFLQEGWHFMPQEQGFRYNGVVYNEMKGAFSDPSAVGDAALMKLLYPDSCYRFVAGGVPEVIPSLSYEEFTETHRRCYQPENAVVYLDGAINISAVLEVLDEVFTEKYEERMQESADSSHKLPAGEAHNGNFVFQQPIPYQIEETTFQAEDWQLEEGLGQLLYGKVTGTWEERTKIFALWVLADYLTGGSNEAPLTRCVLDSGLAQEVSLYVMEGMYQPAVILRLGQAECYNRKELEKVICACRYKLQQEGLDKEKLSAIIDQLEYSTLQKSEPKGLARMSEILNIWNYGGDPMEGLLYREIFSQLRGYLNTNYYDRLLAELPWPEEGACVVLYPKKENPVEDIVNIEGDHSAEYHDLQCWKEQKDTIEALACLPKLELSDIRRDISVLETEVITINGVTVLKHPGREAALAQVQLYFSMHEIEREDYPLVSFLTNLLGNIPAAHYSLEELEVQKRRHTGMTDFNVAAYQKGRKEQYIPYFIVTLGALANRLNDALRVLREILTDTSWKDAESSIYIEEMLLQCEEYMRMAAITDGSKTAQLKAMGHQSAAGKVMEAFEGEEFSSWLTTQVNVLEKDPDAAICALQENLARITKQLFSRQALTISYTGGGMEEKAFTDRMTELIDGFTSEVSRDVSSEVQVMKLPEIYETVEDYVEAPSMVAYTCYTANLQDYNITYHPEQNVLSKIITYEYLWNEIRVKGGAYGCGMSISESGILSMYSVRDTMPERTAEVFAGAADFLEAYCSGEQDVDSYIIAAAAEQEPLLDDGELAMQRDFDYLMGKSEEERIAYRRQLCDVTLDSLKKYIPVLRKIADRHAICVVSSRGY